MADRNSQRVGRVSRFGQGIQPQNTGDHTFHLNLFGLAVASDRHFRFSRRVQGNGNSTLGCGQHGQSGRLRGP